MDSTELPRDGTRSIMPENDLSVGTPNRAKSSIAVTELQVEVPHMIKPFEVPKGPMLQPKKVIPETVVPTVGT